MWIKIKYCIMLNNAEDIILNIKDILTLPHPGHLNLALTEVSSGRIQRFVVMIILLVVSFKSSPYCIDITKSEPQIASLSPDV